MKLGELPPEKARDLLWGIVDRFRAAKETHPFKRIKTTVNLSTDDARLIYAAWKYIEKYQNWFDEASKAGGKVGLEQTDIPLTYCVRFLGERIAELSAQGDEKFVVLTERGMEIIETAAAHLDRYGMMMAFKERPTGKWKGKK